MVFANVTRDQAISELKQIKDTKKGSPNKYLWGWTVPLDGHGEGPPLKPDPSAPYKGWNSSLRFPCSEVGAC